MLIWIVLGVVVAMVVAGLFHAEHFINRMKVFIFVLIALLILFSVMGFFTSKETDLKTPQGIIGSVYNYFGWLGDTGMELFTVGKGTINTVGNIIKSNETGTNSNIKDGRR
jgi:hypothetical protein